MKSFFKDYFFRNSKTDKNHTTNTTDIKNLTDISFYKKLKEKLFSTEIRSSFDSYNSEVSNILNLSTYSGVKTEISKTISPFFQISQISSKNTDFDLKQTYGTFCFNNLLLQTSVDQDKIFRIRGTHMYKSIFTKFHTVIGSNSRQKDIFSQLEIDLRNKFNNFCFKMIQPAIKGASCIYVGNYMQQLGILSIGGEVIKAEEYIGLSLAGRCETLSTVSTISLQQFNTLSVDYYKKISSLLDFGIKVSTSCRGDSSSSYGLGFRVRSKRGDVSGSIDNNRILSVVYNDKLSEGLALNMSCRMGKNVFEYGYGFIYEF